MADDPLAVVRNASEGCFAGYRALRGAAKSLGLIDPASQELILIAIFATAGDPAGIREHARRARAIGHSLPAIEQAILLTFGATTTMTQVSSALTTAHDAFYSGE